MDFALEDLPTVFGADFLEIEWPITACKNLKELEQSSRGLLPSLEGYTEQEEFCDVYMGHSKTEFFAVFDVAAPVEKTVYPEFKKGDAIELIIDTNPSKTQSVTGRFTHHFVVLPAPYEGVIAKEITRFRGNEGRSLIPDEEIRITVEKRAKSYKLSIMIAKNSFKGFDESTKRLGVGYRVHRHKGEVQEFPLNSRSMHFDVHPCLLAIATIATVEGK